MLDDASAPNPFAADAYLAEHHIRLLLCLPLVKEGTLIGALYFEDPSPPHLHAVPDRASHAAGVPGRHLAGERASLSRRSRARTSSSVEELHKPVARTHDLAADESFGGQSTPFRTPSPSWVRMEVSRRECLRARYTGLSLEEVTDEDSRGRRFHPDDVARLEEERRQAVLRGEPFETEERARRQRRTISLVS